MKEATSAETLMTSVLYRLTDGDGAVPMEGQVPVAKGIIQQESSCVNPHDEKEFDDDPLTLSEELTLELILNNTKKRGYCYMQNDKLAAKRKKSIPTITRHVSKFVQRGYLRFRRVGNKRWLYPGINDYPMMRQRLPDDDPQYTKVTEATEVIDSFVCKTNKELSHHPTTDAVPSLSSEYQQRIVNAENPADAVPTLQVESVRGSTQPVRNAQVAPTVAGYASHDECADSEVESLREERIEDHDDTGTNTTSGRAGRTGRDGLRGDDTAEGYREVGARSQYRGTVCDAGPTRRRGTGTFLYGGSDTRTRQQTEEALLEGIEPPSCHHQGDGGDANGEEVTETHADTGTGNRTGRRAGIGEGSTSESGKTSQGNDCDFPTSDTRTRLKYNGTSPTANLSRTDDTSQRDANPGFALLIENGVESRQAVLLGQKHTLLDIQRAATYLKQRIAQGHAIPKPGGFLRRCLEEGWHFKLLDTSPERIAARHEAQREAERVRWVITQAGTLERPDADREGREAMLAAFGRKAAVEAGRGIGA